jgi:hypothetical protein
MIKHYRATRPCITAVKFEGTAESAAEIQEFSGLDGYFDKIDNSWSAGNAKLMPGDYLCKADDTGGIFAYTGDAFPRSFTEI